jgi:hypothetical protein
MLDLCTDLSFQGFELIGNSVFGRVSQNTSFARSHGNMSGGLGLGAPLGPTVTSIRKDGSLFASEKFFNRCKVVHISTRRLKTVNKPRLCIHSNMRLHSKVPVVPFFGLMHLRVSHAGGVLRRTWRFNDRVESTIVPLDRRSPLLKRYWLIKAKIFSVIP